MSSPNWSPPPDKQLNTSSKSDANHFLVRSGGFCEFERSAAPIPAAPGASRPVLETPDGLRHAATCHITQDEKLIRPGTDTNPQGNSTGIC
jgi:hypothetical protein